MKRAEKLATEFGRQVSTAISQVFPMDESGVFTIRNVEILADFSQAKIFISRIGGAEDFFPRLNHAKNRIAKEVFRHISMRRTPEIVFYEDFRDFLNGCIRMDTNYLSSHNVLGLCRCKKIYHVSCFAKRRQRRSFIYAFASCFIHAACLG